MLNPSSASSSSRSEEPKYKGVRKRKWGKWVSEIRLPNSRERIWLGSYDTAEKAARAFDAAQFCLRGRNAKFNFPDNPPDIVGAQSLNPSEIQAAAAEFANSYQAPEAKTGVAATSAGEELTHVMELDDTSLSSASDSGVHADIDWSLLDDMLDHNGSVGDFGLFSAGYDNLHGDIYMPPPDLGTKGEESNNDDDGDGNGGGHYSHHFLWNF